MQVSYHTPVAFATNVSERETPPNSAAPIITLKIPASFGLCDKKARPGAKNPNTHFPLIAFNGIAALAEHIGKGNAVCVSEHKGGYRHADNFIRQVLAGIDLDNAGIDLLAADSDVSRYFGLLYETPSSTPQEPHARALTRFETPIDNLERARLANVAILYHFRRFKDAGLDESCKDTSRMYYGSSKGRQCINEGAYLPDAVLEQWIQDYLAFETQQAIEAARVTALRVTPAVRTSTPANASHVQKRKHAYALNALNNNAATLAATPIGGGHYGGRSNALIALLCLTLNLAYTLENTLSDSEIVDTLTRAAAASGLSDHEIQSAVKSAMSYRREIVRGIRANFEDDARGQFSAGAECSLIGETNELTYYDDPNGEGAPDLATLADRDIAQDDESLSLYPLQLADSWMFAIEDTRTALAAGLLNIVYGLVHQGSIAPRFTTKALLEALEIAGYAFDEKRIRTTMSVLVKAQLIDKSSKNVDFSKSAHYKIDIHNSDDSTCAVFEKMKNASGVYQVLDTVTLGQRIQARVFEALLDDFYPHGAEAIDSARADLMTIEDMRSTLDTLAARWNLNTLSKEAVYAAVPQGLKVALKHKDDTAARHENARRKAVFYSVIRVIPPLVTTNGLMALGLTQDAAAAAAGRLNAVSGQRDKHGVISAKWAVLLQCYKRRMKLLEDTKTTPFTEADLQDGKAQLDTLRRARHIAYDNMPLSGSKQASLLGVDNRASAVRLSKRLGLRREERSERRALIVNRHNDGPILTEAVYAAIKGVVKKGEFATHVFTYDEHGQLFDSAPFEELEDMRLGVSFEVHVQMTSIMHVEDKPARAAAADTPKQAHDAAIEGAEAVSKQARRVHRTTLYTPQWVALNMLAPRGISARETSYGKLWINHDTGDSFEDAAAAVLSLIEDTAASVSSGAVS